MAVAPTDRSSERELLDAARTGSDDAFRRIVETYRPELHAHCYRMLGSLHDADDALQDTLLRAWRGLAAFGGRSSLRTWLHRIATNASLDVIARRRSRVLPVDFGPSSEPGSDAGQLVVESVWIEPYPDESVGVPSGAAPPDARYEEREALELAFVAALQHLPGTQRAVLIMRDVLGFSARESAETLDTTVASVNSALIRARKTIEERLPEQSQQATLRSLGDDGTRELVEAYLDAWDRADVEGVAALLAEGATFSMPPWPAWWRGRDAIAAFAAIAAESCPSSRRLAAPIRANAQPATATYSLDAATGRYLAAAIDVYTLEGGLIRDITSFVMPEVFSRFGLPAELPSGAT